MSGDWGRVPHRLFWPNLLPALWGLQVSPLIIPISQNSWNTLQQSHSGVCKYVLLYYQSPKTFWNTLQQSYSGRVVPIRSGDDVHLGRFGWLRSSLSICEHLSLTNSLVLICLTELLICKNTVRINLGGKRWCKDMCQGNFWLYWYTSVQTPSCLACPALLNCDDGPDDG